MADTVISLVEQALAQIAGLAVQMAALTAQVTALAGQDNTAIVSLHQLVSDTQAAVLHVQDSIGQPHA